VKLVHPLKKFITDFVSLGPSVPEIFLRLLTPENAPGPKTTLLPQLTMSITFFLSPHSLNDNSPHSFPINSIVYLPGVSKSWTTVLSSYAVILSTVPSPHDTEQLTKLEFELNGILN